MSSTARRVEEIRISAATSSKYQLFVKSDSSPNNIAFTYYSEESNFDTIILYYTTYGSGLQDLLVVFVNFFLGKQDIFLRAVVYPAVVVGKIIDYNVGSEHRVYPVPGLIYFYLFFS